MSRIVHPQLSADMSTTPTTHPAVMDLELSRTPIHRLIRSLTRPQTTSSLQLSIQRIKIQFTKSPNASKLCSLSPFKPFITGQIQSKSSAPSLVETKTLMNFSTWMMMREMGLNTYLRIWSLLKGIMYPTWFYLRNRLRLSPLGTCNLEMCDSNGFSIWVKRK